MLSEIDLIAMITAIIVTGAIVLVMLACMLSDYFSYLIKIKKANSKQKEEGAIEHEERIQSGCGCMEQNP